MPSQSVKHIIIDRIAEISTHHCHPWKMTWHGIFSGTCTCTGKQFSLGVLSILSPKHRTI